jgi:hypothetical protein
MKLGTLTVGLLCCKFLFSLLILLCSIFKAFELFVRLSGGAYLGFYHMGVVKALWSQGLLPRVFSGASAGSIMTAIIGCVPFIYLSLM